MDVYHARYTWQLTQVIVVVAKLKAVKGQKALYTGTKMLFRKFGRFIWPQHNTAQQVTRTRTQEQEQQEQEQRIEIIDRQPPQIWHTVDLRNTFF